MKTLVALIVLAVATAEPQWVYDYRALGHPGIVTSLIQPGQAVLSIPQTVPHVVPQNIPQVIPQALYPYQYQVPYSPVVPNVGTHAVAPLIPSQDTSQGLPQPVEDTAEVKLAKARFAEEYQKAALLASQSPENHRRRRDTHQITAVLSPVPRTSYDHLGEVPNVFAPPHHYYYPYVYSGIQPVRSNRIPAVIY